MNDRRVVFFCGAGISCPAGLPGFAKLVNKLYDELNVTPDRLQRAAIKDKRFDTAIGLLERGIVDGRAKVRRTVAEIPQPRPECIERNCYAPGIADIEPDTRTAHTPRYYQLRPAV